VIVDDASARAYVAGLCDASAMVRLERLLAMLGEENGRQNLVSRASLDRAWQRHIADSAQLLRFVARQPARPWLDLGSGAGFPGLVVAVMRPAWSVRLVESRRKRIDWLEHVATELGLANCQVEGERLQNLASFPAGVISARAFAPLPETLALAARFSTSATTWLLPKGRSAAQELEQLPREARKLFHVEQSLTDLEAGIVVSKEATSA